MNQQELEEIIRKQKEQRSAQGLPDGDVQVMPSDLPPRLLSDFNIALHMVLERNVMQQMQYKIGVKASEGKPARDKYIRILIFEDGFVYDPEVNSGLPASN